MLCRAYIASHSESSTALHPPSLSGLQVLMHFTTHKQGMSHLRGSPVMELLVLQLLRLLAPLGSALAALGPFWQHEAAKPAAAARQVVCVAKGAMLPVWRQLAVVLLLEARMAVQQRLLYVQAFVRRLLLLGQHPHLVEGGLGWGRGLGGVCRHRSGRLAPRHKLLTCQ